MQKYLVPKEDLLVRDPVSFNPLPSEGGWVDWNGSSGRYWRRRVRDKDAFMSKPPVLAKTTSTKKKKEV